MTLQEIINNIDLTDTTNREEADLDTLKQEFDICDDVDWNKAELYVYRWHKWLCTDSYVGMSVLVYLNRVRAVISQTGRKSPEHIRWVSEDDKDDVKKHMEEITIKYESNNHTYLTIEDLNTEWGRGMEISYSSQLLTNEVIYKKTMQKVKVVHTFGGNTSEEIADWGFVIIMVDGLEEKVSMEDILVPYSGLQKRGEIL